MFVEPAKTLLKLFHTQLITKDKLLLLLYITACLKCFHFSIFFMFFFQTVSNFTSQSRTASIIFQLKNLLPKSTRMSSSLVTPNCEDLIDHCGYIHNLSSCGI